MIEHQVEQGSPAWLQLRLGIPTASEFDKILTPKTMKLSSQARGYAFRLVAETLLGYPVQDLGNLPWIERGKELEPQAVRSYEFDTDLETRAVGFITTDDGMIGASPDRLIVDVCGGVELKCPAPATHVGYLIDGFGTDYAVQVQGQMLVGELDFVDRYSFHPELPPVRERVYRDDKMIAALRDALGQFLEMKAEMMAKAQATGFFTPKPDELDEFPDAMKETA